VRPQLTPRAQLLHSKSLSIETSTHQQANDDNSHRFDDHNISNDSLHSVEVHQLSERTSTPETTTLGNHNKGRNSNGRFGENSEKLARALAQA
jgi:hypothetical protein